MRVLILSLLSVSTSLRLKLPIYTGKADHLRQSPLFDCVGDPDGCIPDPDDVGQTWGEMNCQLSSMTGKPWCLCPVDYYYACLNPVTCKDDFGFCDPAMTFYSAWIEQINFISEFTPETCDVIENDFNGYVKRECQESFTASYKYPDDDTGDFCVCYEDAVNAPLRYDFYSGEFVSYGAYVLSGSYMSFPYLYDGSVMEPISCAGRGIHEDKKVHPCYRHSYTAFRNAECQDAYRVYRQEKMDADLSPIQIQWNEIEALLWNWTEFYPLTITQGMYAGSCNFGI